MKQYSTGTHRYEEVTEPTDYRNNAVVPTIDLTTQEDGTLRRYCVRELRQRNSVGVTVEATSKAEAKEIAVQQFSLVGKLSADII